VVENPSVLEAALARGHTAPLACTSGQLRAVDHALLQLAVDQGVALQYAGDMDGPGLGIAHTAGADRSGSSASGYAVVPLHVAGLRRAVPQRAAARASRPHSRGRPPGPRPLGLGQKLWRRW
jgi:hypothetical protein